jgi:hypothetical protein
MAAKWRRTSIRILIGVLVAATLVLAVRAVLNYATGKRLEKDMAQARSEGVPMRVKDIVPDCPDADNGARLWRAAEALLLVESEDKPLFGKATDALLNGRASDLADRDRLSRLIERNRQALDLVAEAAAKPCFRYRTWDKPVYETDIPKALNMIRAVKLLAVDVVLRADKGEVGQALNECRSGMIFFQRTLDEPVLLDTLIAEAARKILQAAFNRAAQDKDLDAGTLTAWLRDMDPAGWRSRFNRCIAGERAMGFEVWAEALNGSPEIIKGFYGPGPFHRAVGWMLRPLFKAQAHWAMSHYAELERTAARPYYEQREWFAKRVQDDGSIPWREKLLGPLLPELGSVFLKEARLEAMMLTARAGLACKIYKSKTGRYPEKLEALAPDILPEIPIDPFTGKPLVYKIANGELLIYSLGSNQKDDGGRGGPMTQLVQEKDDDWTWREKIAEAPNQ